jgi:hypothetical protein
MKVPSQSITAAEAAARQVLQQRLGWEAGMVSDEDLNAVVVEVLTAAFAAVPQPKVVHETNVTTTNERPSPTP